MAHWVGAGHWVVWSVAWGGVRILPVRSVAQDAFTIYLPQSVGWWLHPSSLRAGVDTKVKAEAQSALREFRWVFDHPQG